MVYDLSQLMSAFGWRVQQLKSQNLSVSPNNFGCDVVCRGSIMKQKILLSDICTTLTGPPLGRYMDADYGRRAHT